MSDTQAKERHYHWMPQPNISAHELALAMNVLFTGVTGNDPTPAYEQLPKEAQRHFLVLDPDSDPT